MTTNYIRISENLDIRQAMHELVKQAGEHDNISTIYVVDENGIFVGAVDLKDLIIARAGDDLDALISSSYPYLSAGKKISDCIELIKDYAEDSLPVVDEQKKLIGILTAQDIIEAVDDEMGEDYAKACRSDRRRGSQGDDERKYEEKTSVAGCPAVSRHGCIHGGRSFLRE